MEAPVASLEPRMPLHDFLTADKTRDRPFLRTEEDTRNTGGRTPKVGGSCAQQGLV
jgi:hypothetical protein